MPYVLSYHDIVTMLTAYGFLGLVGEIQSVLANSASGSLKAVKEAREYLAAREFAAEVSEQYRSNEREGLEGEVADALDSIKAKLSAT